MRYEIENSPTGLRYREISVGQAAPGAAQGSGVAGDMVFLGDDRFLVRLDNSPEIRSIAFFGSDAQRRATNLVVPMFATRRIDQPKVHASRCSH